MEETYRFEEISTDTLSTLINDERVRIIDIRSPEAYNGWPLMNEKRGGHIKNAKSLPAKWADYIDWIEIVRHKGIKPEHEIIIYGYSKNEPIRVAERFEKAGYKSLRLYTNFVKEWSARDELPMQKLERYQHLVSPAWVNSLINGERPMHFENNKYIVVHVHYRNRDAYLSGHIPGAIDMDTLALEAPETWNRRTPAELKEAFEKHGISAGTTVVIYGKFMFPDSNDPFPGSAAGDIGAIRCAFIMIYAGVKDVRVLNGGFRAWQDAGYEISFDDEPKTSVQDFGSAIPVLPGLAVDTPGAKEIIQSDDSELVCVRSRAEYLGEVSGYNYIEAKGRIPGAVFADCGSDAYHMENYRNVDHTTREYHEIADIWNYSGITKNKHIAFYCGTGWRGSEAWFNAWLMGWPRVSVYDGGWYEWSNDPDNPYETGEPSA